MAGSRLELSGDQAFQLHDTYGFPIDLTLEMASEQGLAVDEDGFRRLMAEQRRRAKDDSRAKKTGNADISVLTALLERSGKVTFTGYEESSGEATVVGLLVNGAPVPAAGAGTEVEVVLDRTPFYAEGGGQLADTLSILRASARGRLPAQRGRPRAKGAAAASEAGSASGQIGAPTAKPRNVFRRLDRFGLDQKALDRAAVPEPIRPDSERRGDLGDKRAEARSVERPQLSLDGGAVALAELRNSPGLAGFEPVSANRR